MVMWCACAGSEWLGCGLKIRTEMCRVVAHVHLQVTVDDACGCNPRQEPVSAPRCGSFGGALVQKSCLESEKKEGRLSRYVITSVWHIDGRAHRHRCVPFVLQEVACEHCLLLESQLLLCFLLHLEKSTCPFCSSF